MRHKFTFFIGLIASVVFGASLATPIFAEEDNTQTSIEPIATEEASPEPISTEPAESEEAPEMWPVYLSLGAIGVTFLLIVIINLTSRRYNQK